MAALYPNGLGGTVDAIALNAPLYGLDCVAWYVHSGTGTDAVSPRGRDIQAPLATLGQAVTNASANDVIVLLDGHEEVVVALTLSKRGMVIVGCGQTAGVPNVTIRNDDTADGIFTVSAANVQLRNIKFEGNEQANAEARITVNGAGFVVDGCYFECGAFDTGTAIMLSTGADYATIRDTTFISTATVAASRPESAVKSNAAIAGLRLDGIELSDGTYGFSNGYSLDLNGGAVTDLLADSVSLLLGASMRLGSSCTGYVLPTVTGGGLVDI